MSVQWQEMTKNICLKSKIALKWVQYKKYFSNVLQGYTISVFLLQNVIFNSKILSVFISYYLWNLIAVSENCFKVNQFFLSVKPNNNIKEQKFICSKTKIAGVCFQEDTI